jgi:hypothetical protein
MIALKVLLLIFPDIPPRSMANCRKNIKKPLPDEIQQKQQRNEQ